MEIDLDKYSTKEKAVILRYNNPYLTLEQIGKGIGVTRQRVHAIFKRYRIPPRPPKPPKVLPYCDNCGLISWSGNRFCCKECRVDYYFAQIPCSNCGQLIKKMRKCVLKFRMRKLKQYNFYCNKECFYERKRKRHITNTPK